jgi:hypothetical protein
MKDLIRSLILDTVSKLVKKGLTQEEAVDQVVGLLDLNKDSLHDISYVKILLNKLVDIS